MSAALADRALDFASAQVGVRESGRNRGRQVDEYLRAVGLDPQRGSYPWCAAFVYWCYKMAAADLGLVNPLPRTARVHALWSRSPALVRTKQPRAGAIFCIDKGSGKGHTGIVVSATALDVGRIVTIEGNTNLAGDREGDGVYRRLRAASEINLGYVDHGQDLDPFSGAG